MDLLDGVSPHSKTVTSKKSNIYIIFIALYASLNSIMAGYCVGSMSGAVLFVIKDLNINAKQEELLIASVPLFGVVGSLVAGRLADAIGRKNTMAFAVIVCLTSSLVMAFAPAYNILLLGRLLSGVSVGAVYVIAPLYITEVSPPEIRGSLISFPEMFLSFGILLSYFSCYLLSGLPYNINWRIMVSLGALPAILLLCGLWFMPESPRWLVLKGRINEARRFLIKIAKDEDDADQKLQDIIIAGGQAPQSINSDENIIIEDVEQSSSKSDNRIPLLQHHKNETRPRSVWQELLCPDATIGRILFVTMAFQLFNQGCGLPAILYYSPSIFANAGIKSASVGLGSTVLVGLTRTIFVLVATFFVDKLGRRFLLITSGLGMTASMGALATAFLSLKDGSSPYSNNVKLIMPSGAVGPLALISTCSFVAFYSIGFGPICNLLVSELFPLRIRAQGMSVALVLNRMISGIISLTFLTVSSAITPAGEFFIFTLISGFSGIFVYFLVPETAGKTLEEIN